MIKKVSFLAPLVTTSFYQLFLSPLVTTSFYHLVTTSRYHLLLSPFLITSCYRLFLSLVIICSYHLSLSLVLIAFVTFASVVITSLPIVSVTFAPAYAFIEKKNFFVNILPITPNFQIVESSVNSLLSFFLFLMLCTLLLLSVEMSLEYCKHSN